MPKRGLNIHYGVTFETEEDKEKVQSIVGNIKDKTKRNAGDIIKSALVEYDKLFDDKGNLI